MVRTPLLCSASVITLIASGESVAEGLHKPVGSLDVGSSGQLIPRKASSIIVMSPELVRSNAADSQALVRRSMQAGMDQGDR